MSQAAVWGGIAAIVVTAVAGDVLQSVAMKEIGDVGVLRRSSGWLAVVGRVISSPRFLLGLFFMALTFFCLMVTLSWGDLSIVGPASASLTFIGNALAARIFLKEHVGRRRWLATAFVAAGVVLLAR